MARSVLLTAGFLQIPFKKDLENLHALYWVEQIKEEEGCLVLSHKDCPILFVSSWRPRAGEEHFEFNSNSNKLGQGIFVFHFLIFRVIGEYPLFNLS